jgi:hypothetical protein
VTPHLSEGALDLRALMPEDAGATRALVSGQFGGTRYEARTLAQLESALRFEDPEYVAVLALSGEQRKLLGLVLFGTVAGARLVLKVHALVGDDREVLRTLLGAVRGIAEKSGERMIVCELPDDAPFAPAAAALSASEYREEGRVPDFIRDGVALRLLSWRPGVR